MINHSFIWLAAAAYAALPRPCTAYFTSAPHPNVPGFFLFTDQRRLQVADRNLKGLQFPTVHGTTLFIFQRIWPISLHRPVGEPCTDAVTTTVHTSVQAFRFVSRRCLLSADRIKYRSAS
jgi:hypothetical protein